MGASRLFHLLVIGALGATLSAASPAVEADQPKSKADASATVTVTAEATPVDLAKTPNPVKVITAETIRRSGARNLAELLQQVFPGQILSYGGPGTASSLYLGGTRAQDVVVLLDGIRITDASNLNPDFATVGLECIDRVEILRGPASTRYGADTHGGVVALYSAAPGKAGLSGEALLGGGNNGSAFGQAAPAYAWGNGWARLDLRARREDQSTPTTNPFREDGGALSLGQQVGDDGFATLTYRNHFQATPIPYDASYPAPLYTYQPLYNPDRESSLRNEQLIGSYRQNFSAAFQGDFSLGQSLQDRVEPGFGSGSQRYHSQRNQAVASLAWTPNAASRFGFMLDGSEETAGTPSGSGAPQNDRAEARHLSVGLEQAFDVVDSLRFVASERAQKDRISYAFGGGPTLQDRDNSAFVGKLGLNWMITPEWRAYASFGNSYNTPQLYDLTYNLANGYGDLNNEKSRTLQIGGGYGHGPWTATLEASRTSYSQVVVFVPLPGFNYRYANGTDLRVQSLEGLVGYKAGAWSVEGFLRSQEARNEGVPSDQQLKSSGAFGRPFLVGGLRAAASFGPVDTYLRWSWIGSSYQYFDALGAVDGTRTHFNDLGLGAIWKVDHGLSLELRGEHLMQPKWTVAQWQNGDRFRQNDAYGVPVFPAQSPTVTLAVRYRY